MVIQNPLKNDMIRQRDRKGKVIFGNNNQPVKIQKMVLMSLYRELHLYMIDNYRDMKMDDGKVLFSEFMLRKIMPRHIKKEVDRYKQMCGCQVCIIFKDMYSCLRLWRKKCISRLQTEIDAMQQRSRNRSTKQDILDAYKSQVMHNDTIVPERAWNAVAALACPMVDIENDDGVRSFHKFGCVMGQCDQCPTWNTTIPALEMQCSEPIRYCIYGSYHECKKHGQSHMSIGGSNKPYCLVCNLDDAVVPLKYIKKNYIRMMKSEPMNEFIKEGGTYATYSRAMLYHTFLVVMLGSPVLAKSVEEEVLSNERNSLFRRDHSQRYTPRQTGEIIL